MRDVEANPKNYMSYYYLGLLAENSSTTPSAIFYYQKAFENMTASDDKYFEIKNKIEANSEASMEVIKRNYVNEGYEFMNKQDWDNAEIAFKKSIENGENSLQVYESLANIEIQRRDFLAMDKYYSKVLEIEPSRQGIRSQIISVYSNNKKCDKALERGLFFSKENLSDTEA